MKKNLLMLSAVCLLLVVSCSKVNDPDLAISPPEEILNSLSEKIIAGGQKSSIDGVGINASFSTISEISVTKNGTIYVLEFVDSENGIRFKIRKITTDGKVTTAFEGEDVAFEDDKPISANKIIWNLKDILVNADGNVFVLAHKTDFSAFIGTRYLAEQGIFKLNLQTSKLESVITSKQGSGNGVTFPYQFDQFAIDGNGVFYGAMQKAYTKSGKTEIYKVTPSGKELIAAIDEISTYDIFPDVSGNIFIYLPDGITKISSKKEISSYYKFEKESKNYHVSFAGDNSGSFIVYGSMFKASGGLLGYGFYEITKERKKIHIGKISSDLSIGIMALNGLNQAIYSPIRTINGGAVLMKSSWN